MGFSGIGSSDRHEGGFEPLLELATPDLYRRNSFRVLGLRVDAPLREIQRTQQRRLMQERLGIDSGDSPTRSLSLSSVSAEEQRRAVERLARPVDRFLDELFWFWPLGPEDRALEALDQGELRQAGRIWEDSLQGPQRGRSLHNLAVLYHCQALDADGGPLPDEFSKKVHELAPFWEPAFRSWQSVLEEDGFWHNLRDRAVSSDDRHHSL